LHTFGNIVYRALEPDPACFVCDTFSSNISYLLPVCQNKRFPYWSLGCKVHIDIVYLNVLISLLTWPLGSFNTATDKNMLWRFNVMVRVRVELSLSTISWLRACISNVPACNGLSTPGDLAAGIGGFSGHRLAFRLPRSYKLCTACLFNRNFTFCVGIFWLSFWLALGIAIENRFLSDIDVSEFGNKY